MFQVLVARCHGESFLLLGSENFVEWYFWIDKWPKGEKESKASEKESHIWVLWQSLTGQVRPYASQAKLWWESEYARSALILNPSALWNGRWIADSYLSIYAVRFNNNSIANPLSNCVWPNQVMSRLYRLDTPGWRLHCRFTMWCGKFSHC